METITTNNAPLFILQYVYVEDINRGGGVTYTAPKTVAVVPTLDTAIELAKAIGDVKYARILEVRNPLMIDGEMATFPTRTHAVPVEASTPTARKRPGAAARKTRR